MLLKEVSETQTRNEPMKRQATVLIIDKQSERRIFLSAGLTHVALSSNLGLVAGAQSINNSSLPPEVIPVNSAIKYASNSVANNISSNQVPGIVSPAPAVQASQPAYQSAQEARQEIFNSLMGTNVYPQFNGRPCAFSQADNMAGVPATSQGTQQTLSNIAQSLLGALASSRNASHIVRLTKSTRTPIKLWINIAFTISELNISCRASLS